MPTTRPLSGRIAAAAVALALAGAPVAAADLVERRLAALFLLESEADFAMIHRLSADPVQQLIRATHAMHPDLSPQQMMVLSALYHDEMYRAALAALRTRAAELAARYSLTELQALQAFADTPDGRELLREEGMPVGGLDRLIEGEMLARMDAAFDRHGRAP